MAWSPAEELKKVCEILGVNGPVRSVRLDLTVDSVPVFHVERFAKPGEVEKVAEAMKEKSLVEDKGTRPHMEWFTGSDEARMEIAAVEKKFKEKYHGQDSFGKTVTVPAEVKKVPLERAGWGYYGYVGGVADVDGKLCPFGVDGRFQEVYNGGIRQITGSIYTDMFQVGTRLHVQRPFEAQMVVDSRNLASSFNVPRSEVGSVGSYDVSFQPDRVLRKPTTFLDITETGTGADSSPSPEQAHAGTCEDHWTGGLSGICPRCKKP